MITPAGYTEWGYLGAVVFLVMGFLVFIIRRDKEWRTFFTGIRAADGEAVKQLVGAIEKLVARVENLEVKFDRHDAAEMEFIRSSTLKARSKKTTGPLSPPDP